MDRIIKSDLRKEISTEHQGGEAASVGHESQTIPSKWNNFQLFQTPENSWIWKAINNFGEDFFR